MLKNLLDSRPDYHNSICETIALKLAEKKDVLARLDSIGHIGKILCVVSTFQIELVVPHFNLSDVFDGNAITEIQTLINTENTFEEIGQSLANMLKNINSKNVFNDVREAIQRIELQAQMELLPDVLIGVFCHIGCMIDRMIENSQVVEFPDKDAYIRSNSKLCDIVKASCAELEQKFKIVIPDDEICYITSYFTAGNCVSKS